MECEEIERTFPSSFRLVPHNVSGIPATLWLTMWTECEEFVSLNEDTLLLCILSKLIRGYLSVNCKFLYQADQPGASHQGLFSTEIFIL